MRDPQMLAVCVLDPLEASELTRAADAIVPPHHGATYASFLAGCRRGASGLPRRVRDWQRDMMRAGIGLLRNVPVDQPLPPTPTEKGAADELPLTADRIHGLLSSLFGRIYTLGDKICPRLIQNLYPARGDEYTQLGTSIVELEWHVEEACHAARPDWVSLFCLRGDSRASTGIARAKDLSLSGRMNAVPRQRRFRLRLDETFTAEGEPRRVIRPVLFGPKKDPGIIFDPAYTEPGQAEEARAIAAVSRAADEACVRLTLDAGDYLVFDNRRVIHCRTAFQPRMDGTDRWLKRSLILRPRRCAGRVFDGVLEMSATNSEVV